MPAVFKMTPTAPFAASQSTLLGAGTGSANNLSDLDKSKFVKLVAASRMDLCAVGDQIEGFITSVEAATQNGYSFGGVAHEGKMYVTLDGLQATPGVGAIAIGDYLVAGTVTARGTILPGAPKVCKATAAANTLLYKWRLVEATATAVGTVGVMERVG
jgi:hypothetical protein